MPENAKDYHRSLLERYNDGVLAKYHDNIYLDYPFLVSIETFAKCNALCDFCPYPTLDRIGTRLSDKAFERILFQLQERKQDGQKMMSLSRVNEPFLDVRIFDFVKRINELFPETWLMHISNASPLNEKVFDKVIELQQTARLKISFNDHRLQAYEQTMKLPYEKVITNI